MTVLCPHFVITLNVLNFFGRIVRVKVLLQIHKQSTNAEK